MNSKHQWILRTLAATALATSGLVLDSTDAGAATTNDTFEVRATVVGTCTLTASDLQFPNYESGSATAETGSASFVVNCAGAAVTPVAAQLRFDTVSGSFAMLDPVSSDTLNYGLFEDAGLTTAFAEGVNRNVTIDAEPDTVTIYGQIPSGQAVSLGDYAQTVTATLTY